MRLSFHTLDVFTKEAFTGNPLAVVMDAKDLTGAQMQAIAREFNLSETVFVLPAQDAGNTARLRIFTPVAELPFAGHPTVGAAVLLADLQKIDGEVRLEEGVGPVVVDTGVRDEHPYGEFTAATLPEPVPEVPDEGAIAAALGLTANDIGFGTHRASVFDPGNHPMLYVPVASRDALAKAAATLSAWSGLRAAGDFLVYVYCAAVEGRAGDFHARAFAPMAGVPEDPATGSAAAGFAGPLGNFEVPWSGARSWLIVQGEDMGRRSEIYLSADARDGTVSAVRVGGHAVRISEGQLNV